MAPNLLFSLGHNPRLGGTNLVWGAQAVIWGAQAVIWGAQPRNAPRGVRLAARLQQFIEL